MATASATGSTAAPRSHRVGYALAVMICALCASAPLRAAIVVDQSPLVVLHPQVQVVRDETGRMTLKEAKQRFLTAPRGAFVVGFTAAACLLTLRSWFPLRPARVPVGSPRVRRR